MATEITKYGDLNRKQAGHYTAKILENTQHLVVLERFGQVDPQPKNKSKTRVYVRYSPLAAATAPLAEAVTPAGQKLSRTEISVVLQQFGDVVTLSDVVLDTCEEPAMDQAVKLMTPQIAETTELNRFYVLRGGTNVDYAGTATTRATVNGTISRSDIRRIVRSLDRGKAQKITEIIGATAKVSTTPVEASFFAVCHNDLKADIRNCKGFVHVSQYSDHMKALPGEVGSIEDVRFICTGLLTPWAAAGTAGTTYLANGDVPATSTACDVYPVLIFGRDAYAMVPLQGSQGVHIAVKNPAPVVGDELGQKGFASWKRMDATIILQQYFMMRYEVACTANPPE